MRFALYPGNRKDLSLVISFLVKNEVRFRVFGNTSNCLFLESDSYDVFVFTQKSKSLKIANETGIVEVDAGLSMSLLARKTVECGLKGFEGVVGVPGTVGGGIFMNAGSFGCEMSDRLVSVNYFDNDSKEEKWIESEALGFGYRTSAFSRKEINGVILGATFMCKKESSDTLKRKLDLASESRRTFQEKKLVNLGSLFATTDIYAEIAKHHKIYWFMLKLYRLLRRIKIAFFEQRITDNRELNELTLRFFRKRFSHKPFSDKTLNCFVNDSADEHVFFEYVNWIQLITKGKLKLENEVVRGSLKVVGIDLNVELKKETNE